MNISTLDLNLLRVFAAVYAERNVTRAARRLGITQPTISNAMSRLRRSLGDPLFVRTSRGMEPTTFALSVSGSVEQALALLRTTFEAPAGFDPRSSSKTFHLLTSDAGEAIVLPRLMERLYEMAPQVSVEALQAPHDEYTGLMENGSADLALGNLQFMQAGFFQQRLFDDPYVCICTPNHPLARKGSITLKQYLEAPHVSVSAGSADALVERALGRRRLQRRIQLRLSNYHVAVDVVATTRLLATVPRTTITPRVRAIELPFTVPPANVRQFWHARVHRDAANTWFRSLLAGLFGQQLDQVTNG